MTASPRTIHLPLSESDVLVSARSLAEYTDMFSLDDADLGGRIVDCPGGAASAVAEICAAGGDAIAVDPLYALGGGDLRERVLADLDRSLAHFHSRDLDYDWDVRGGVVGHESVRRTAAESMLADLEVAPGRYVAGALPDLPLASDSADLVLCS
ncbi:MAG: hypothetical protein U1C73_09910, partial [Dietzia sp.]|nr:hypothetical protein [Dietzia sp.]